MKCAAKLRISWNSQIYCPFHEMSSILLRISRNTQSRIWESNVWMQVCSFHEMDKLRAINTLKFKQNLLCLLCDCSSGCGCGFLDVCSLMCFCALQTFECKFAHFMKYACAFEYCFFGILCHSFLSALSSLHSSSMSIREWDIEYDRKVKEVLQKRLTGEKQARDNYHIIKTFGISEFFHVSSWKN